MAPAAAPVLSTVRLVEPMLESSFDLSWPEPEGHMIDQPYYTRSRRRSVLGDLSVELYSLSNWTFHRLIKHRANRSPKDPEPDARGHPRQLALVHLRSPVLCDHR